MRNGWWLLVALALGCGRTELSHEPPPMAVLLPEQPRDAGVRDAGHGPDLLSPGEIYLAGTLSEGTCGRQALALLSTPNIASVGFDCDFAGTAIVRPTDGRLLYWNNREYLLREYHCDRCSITHLEAYPPDVLTNDTVIPTPCPGADHLEGFLVSVDGEVLHRCALSSSLWRDSTGTVVHTELANDPLRGLGAGGWAISKLQIVNWKTSTQTPISGLPAARSLLATRWVPPDAFYVAISLADDELWKVTTSGVATRVGAYGALPPHTSWAFGGPLDDSGALFNVGQDANQPFVDFVLRRAVGGPSSVVYTEATQPLVKMHLSALVTGP